MGRPDVTLKNAGHAYDDGTRRTEILQTAASLIASSGLRTSLQATTLIVAHRISTITLADRVLFLDGGRVAASGSHVELLATVPAYAALALAYEEGEA